VIEEVRDALADDLDAPRALAAIDRWAEAVATGVGDDTTAPQQIAALSGALLGVRIDGMTSRSNGDV
jgi:L-cysteine:1D-myo-inositol 2-amino-2-deoxy-alpha-D-glucopyranoside ligase